MPLTELGEKNKRKKRKQSKDGVESRVALVVFFLVLCVGVSGAGFGH